MQSRRHRYYFTRTPCYGQNRRNICLVLRTMLGAGSKYTFHIILSDPSNVMKVSIIFYPQSTEQRNLNFQPLEVVSRYCDPQLQVTENLCYKFVKFKYQQILKEHFTFNNWLYRCLYVMSFFILQREAPLLESTRYSDIRAGRLHRKDCLFVYRRLLVYQL